MWRPHQHQFLNQNYYLIAQSRMHTQMQGLYFVIWSFFLETPMIRSEYMTTHSKYFPPDITELYQIDGIIT